MNPTTSIFEKRFTQLEEGIAAIATSSGMSAIFCCIVNLCETGDNILVSSQVYGGTSTLTTHTIKRFGITARFFDMENPDQLESMIDDNTKLILFESLSNPSLCTADFDKINHIAKKYNILSVVDNTVATPYLCKPLTHGCDIVLHSTSKYTNGQGSALGGIIIEADTCQNKIVNSKRYQHFKIPDKSYHD